MSFIKFEKKWEDDDGMLEIAVSASNGTFLCLQHIYVYPEELKSFGQQLNVFPRSIDDEAVLEYGSDDPTCFCQFLLRAFIFNRLGHIAVEVKTDNHQDGIEHTCSHFFIKTEPMLLNKLGNHLCNWTSDMDALHCKL